MKARRNYPPIRELISLSGRRAVVTGGATGLGYAICRRLAEAGAQVVVADIDGAEAIKASDELVDAGYQAIPIQCDVSSEESVCEMVSTAVERVGGIDILVNNAGIYPRIPLASMKTKDFEKVLAVNLKGIFMCSREVSNRMIEQKQGGCIINLGSIDSV
ncbi:MAG TPA: SDR family NAD(P)-dependent oxidoreductase, partial [Dehalococcoidia bacterium]|nr:SDR family NAD(P)-dependent oxidoreductase [Dehalococcoidia bacterium]